MTYDDYLGWCRRVGVTPPGGARLLGLGRNVPAESYSRGKPIPHYIALACAAIEAGLAPVGGVAEDRLSAANPPA